MEGFVVLILFIVLAVAAGFGLWAIARHRYVKSLRDKGWTFITSPDISIVHGLNVPPFGVGFQRKVDDQIIGTAPDGTPFSAFLYRSSNWSSSGYVVAMPLPHSMPPGQVYHPAAPGLNLEGHTYRQGEVVAVAPDADYAQELASSLAPGVTGALRISVDHTNLILFEAPKEADELERAVAHLAALRSALLTSPAALRQGPTPRPGSASTNAPGGPYVARDDSYLQLIDHNGSGGNHTATDIIFSDNYGIPFLRLRHDWETTRTVTDSNGNSRTETDHHTEELCEFRIAFPFRELSVNWGLWEAATRISSGKPSTSG